jgi:hypothetical protein
MRQAAMRQATMRQATMRRDGESVTERPELAETGQTPDAEASSAPPRPGAQPALPNLNAQESLRGIGRSLVINGAVPLLIYNLLKSRGASDITALSVAAVVPAIDGIVTVARKRRIDLLSALVLAGIAISIIAVLLGGDPRLLLIRESFLTVALGVACFVSFLLPRPLMFYFGRYFATADDPAKVANYNALWQYPYFRHVNRVITLVWGVTYVGEFLLRVALVYRLSINQVLAIAPLVFNAITISVILWTFAYARYARRQGDEMRRQVAGAASPEG